MLRFSRIWVPCCLLAATTACDRLVKDGETVTLGGRGSVFGVNTPNAAFVLPGGTLIVSDADCSDVEPSSTRCRPARFRRRAPASSRRVGSCKC